MGEINEIMLLDWVHYGINHSNSFDQNESKIIYKGVDEKILLICKQYPKTLHI